MIEVVQKTKTTRRRSRRWKIEDVCEYTKDKYYKKNIQKMEKTNRGCSRMYERRRLQEEDPEDGKDKLKMFKKTKITKEDIEDEYYRRFSS